MLSRLELLITSLFCAKPGPLKQRNVDGYILSNCGELKKSSALICRIYFAVTLSHRGTEISKYCGRER